MRIKPAFFVGMLTLAYATWLPQPASATCNPSEFTDRIYLWDGSTGSNPPSKALPTPMIEDLGDAYCYAPDDFRYQLLGVDYVFIDATNCMNHDPGSCSTLLPSQSQNASWGERRGWGYTDIGIPAGLWPPQQHAGKYADAESDVLNRHSPDSGMTRG
jgi:hypothetical protein